MFKTVTKMNWYKYIKALIITWWYHQTNMISDSCKDMYLVSAEGHFWVHKSVLTKHQAMLVLSQNLNFTGSGRVLSAKREILGYVFGAYIIYKNKKFVKIKKDTKL